MLEMPLELKEVASDDFFNMGNDLRNPKWGPRYFKYSDDYDEICLSITDYYIGEWSTATNKLHGRGICIDGRGM